MDSELPENEGNSGASLVPEHRNHPKARDGEKGRRAEKTPYSNLAEILRKTVHHFLPGLSGRLDALPDPRVLSRITYDQKHLIWCGLSIFLLQLGSRRQTKYEQSTESFRRNITNLAGTDEKSLAHPDTVNNYLQKLPSDELAELTGWAVSQLIRAKALDAFRLSGHFLIAVDGTGQLVFEKQHCPRCLHRTTKNGETIWFHPVLEAKLVTGNGFAFSVGTEFIENPSGEYDKQDCELKAFYRLAEKLKARFPRLPLCFLLDSLYAGKPVFDIMKINRWKFFITFKEGSMSALYSEAQALLGLSPQNRKIVSDTVGRTRTYRWLTSLPYEEHDLKLIVFDEEGGAAAIHFAWLTNFEVSAHTVENLADNGGRYRWKIENEGFNVQKNGGYALEHTFSSDPNASKNYYYLLQFSHLLQQLMTKGSLLKNFLKTLGSVRNFARRLSEALRNIPMSALSTLAHVGQIRFSSA